MGLNCVKTVVTCGEAAVNVNDVVIAGKTDDIYWRPDIERGVWMELEPFEYRLFLPIFWNNEFGDRIKTWVRVK